MILRMSTLKKGNITSIIIVSIIKSRPSNAIYKKICPIPGEENSNTESAYSTPRYSHRLQMIKVTHKMLYHLPPHTHIHTQTNSQGRLKRLFTSVLNTLVSVHVS